MPAKEMMKNATALVRRFTVPGKDVKIVVQWDKTMTPQFAVWVEGGTTVPGNYERDRQGCASEPQMWALAELIWEKEGGF